MSLHEGDARVVSWIPAGVATCQRHVPTGGLRPVRTGHEELHLGGGGGGEVDGLVGDGMLKPDAVGEQRDAAVLVAAARAILEVALYRMADGGELGADLMLAPREELHFQQGVAVSSRYRAVAESRLLCLRILLRGDEGLVEASVAFEPVLENGLLFIRRSFDERPVCLVDVALAEHVVEAGEGLGGAREDHQPGDGAVDAVNDPAEHIAGLGVFLTDIVLDGLRKGLVAGLVALHYLAGLLAHHNNMVVFVYYLHNDSMLRISMLICYSYGL